MFVNQSEHHRILFFVERMMSAIDADGNSVKAWKILRFRCAKHLFDLGSPHDESFEALAFAKRIALALPTKLSPPAVKPERCSNSIDDSKPEEPGFPHLSILHP